LARIPTIMKTMRNLMLSVLLSAFGFFIVHDYIITDVDTDTQYELCSTEGTIASLDLPSQIHEHIHVLLSIPESHLLSSTGLQADSRPNGTPDTPHSYISPVHPRPPLS
jgi:hypothetical protein